MTNRLASETSPYLIQHAENPVDWYPWGEEALGKARAEDKPIFLSIGYSSCHWCHVMAHESFEDPDVAKVLNQFFVPIKVDREERPDIDSLYMSSVVALTGQGGWPMSVFLKPGGEPFFAGAYFPPERRYGMPGFKEVLFNIRQIWRVNRGEINRLAENTLGHLKMINRFERNTERSFSTETLHSAGMELAASYNCEIHGWGPAPLFPHPFALDYLLQLHTRTPEGGFLDLVVDNLKAMSAGGMLDILGGGFHRYSTDESWLIPHFEKMLYDNAQLARVYLHAWQISGDISFRRVVEQTLDFILREMTAPEGGFFSSLDADSEGEEGAYYTWSSEEVKQALANRPEWEMMQAVFNMKPSEKLAGRFVFQRLLSDEDGGRLYNLPTSEFHHQLETVTRKLLLARFMRIRPVTDDKILTSWNSLAGQAFTEAARVLKRQDYLVAAQRCAAFLRDNLLADGEVYRAYRAGARSSQPGFLEDYASLILFLIELFQTDHNPEWFKLARELVEKMISSFGDESGGFFDTLASDHSLPVRPKTMQDNATPAGSALAARALLLMADLDDRPDWRSFAEDLLSAAHDLAVDHPLAFASFLQAADLAVGPVDQVAVLWPKMTPYPADFSEALWDIYRPRMVAAFSSFPPGAGSPRLLEGRLPQDLRATAFVCRGFTCLQPSTSVTEMLRQLT